MHFCSPMLAHGTILYHPHLWVWGWVHSIDGFNSNKTHECGWHTLAHCANNGIDDGIDIIQQKKAG